MAQILSFTFFLILYVSPVQLFAENMPIPVGSPAPDFTLQDLQGQSHELAEMHKSKYVLVLFWSTNCHFCHVMIPQFKSVQENYANKGLNFVAVNVGYEDATEVKSYAGENELNYLILNNDDKKEGLADTWGLIGTPTLVLIAPDGNVKYYGHRLPDLEKLMQL